MVALAVCCAPGYCDVDRTDAQPHRAAHVGACRAPPQGATPPPRYPNTPHAATHSTDNRGDALKVPRATLATPLCDPSLPSRASHNECEPHARAHAPHRGLHTSPSTGGGGCEQRTTVSGQAAGTRARRATRVRCRPDSCWRARGHRTRVRSQAGRCYTRGRP